MSKKAIALLELTTGGGSTSTYKTVSYYWTLTPIFVTFPLIDVATGLGNNPIEKTINLLNKYYAEGFRIFLGFVRSSVLGACIPWFNEHPDAIGISTSSSSDTLNFPKNIYRLQPTDQTTIEAISNNLQNAIDAGGKIYYVYSQGEIATENVLSLLNATYGPENIKSFAVLPDRSNLTLSNLQEFYNGCTSVDIAVIYVFILGQRTTYLSLFNNTGGLNLPLQQLDIVNAGFPVINESITTLKNKYTCLLIKSVTSSSLWNQGLISLKNSFSSQSLNALYLITSLVNNVSIENIYSYNGVLQFNENNDIAFFNYGFYKYNNDGIFIPNTIFSQDPFYGSVYFNLVT